MTPFPRGRFDAVVFDFDGVITDSTMDHYRAYKELLEPLGVVVEPRDILIREGGKSATIIREIMAEKGKPVSEAEARRIAEEKQRHFRSLGSRRQPRVEETLAGLAGRGYRLALVTGTVRENVHHLIPDLIPRFEVMVTADLTKAEKPDPEPYRMAAERLGLAPDRLVAVENAPRGIASAKAAGYTVIGLTTTLPAEDLAEADFILPGTAEILRVL